MSKIFRQGLFAGLALCGFVLVLCTLTASAQKGTGMNEGENKTDAAVKGNKAMDPVTDVPGLPRVLLIGDSISLGYTVQVRELLAGKANVHRVLRNCGASATGVAGTSPKGNWLGDGKWDVIHFNHGIWDAKLNPATGLTVISDEGYIANLETIADRMKATGATVIFATTTPIPDNLLTEPPGEPLPEKTRLFKNVIERNAAAVAAMQAKSVLIDDLYAAIYPERETYWRPQDLHFTPEGSAVLAKAVAASIDAALAAKAK